MTTKSWTTIISDTKVNENLSSKDLGQLIVGVSDTLDSIGGLDVVSSFFCSMKEDEVNSLILLSLLRITFGARSRIPTWLSFLNRVKVIFDKRGVDQNVLTGLSN